MNSNVPTHGGPGFRPDIEALRGIAVLLVVCFHCGLPGFAGGFVGVDVFFVLSGYLITSLLMAEAGRTARLDLFRFYARRARRLLPAFVVMLVVTLGVGMLILAPQELLGAARAGRGAAVYMSNIFFGRNAADYFAADVRTNPFLHTWSLAVEEQFYLFWPLLILLGTRGRRSKRATLAILAVVTVVSFVVCVWTTANTETFAFYQLPARGWEFGAGGLASMLPAGGARFPRRAWQSLLVAGLILIFLSGSLIPEGPHFPGWLALGPVVGTCLALVGGEALVSGGMPGLLRSGPLPRLGSVSYSWYLWHWPFLVFAAALFPGIGPLGRIVAVTLALGVAAASLVLIENPIRYHPALVSRGSRALAMAPTAALGSLGAAMLAIWFAGQLADSPALRQVAAEAQFDISRIPRARCLPQTDSPLVTTCEFGDTSSAVRIVLFGDSHAMQWFNPLERIAGQHGWRLTTIVKSGCPAVAVDVPDHSARFVRACDAWRAAAVRRIDSLRPAVVVAASSSGYLEVSGKPLRGSGLSLPQWREGIVRTLAALVASGAQVAWLRDTPIPTVDVPTCIERALRHTWYPGSACGMRRDVVVPPAELQATQAAVHGIPGVTLIDMTDHLCGVTTCPVWWHGQLVYHDDSHLTGAFAESLAPALDARLAPIVARAERPRPPA